MLASATIVYARDRLVSCSLNSLIEEYGYQPFDLSGLGHVLTALDHFGVQLDPPFDEDDDLIAKRSLKKRKSEDVLAKKIQEILDAGGENYGVELKSSIYMDTNKRKYIPDLDPIAYKSDKLQQKLAQEICAFLNRTGGIILLGIANDLTVLGCEDDFLVHPGDGTPEDKADLIISSIVSRYFQKPSVILSHLQVQCTKFQNRQVVLIEITNMQTLAFLKKEAANSSELYIRIGTSAQPIQFSEIEDHFVLTPTGRAG